MNTKHIIAVSLTALAFSLVGCAVDTESSEPYELETTGIQRAAATAGEACGNDGDTRVDTDENGC